MDNNTENGNLMGAVTIAAAFLSWIIDNGDMAVKFITGIGSLVTAFFACRYYYYATKEKKNGQNNPK